MNTKNHFYLPKNDDELNAYIHSINSAYDEGFSFRVGEGRFEKLRNVICKHIGFPNGYQQLQAYWKNEYNFNLFGGDKHKASFLFADVFGSYPVAIIAAPIAQWLTAALNEQFPCSKEGLRGDVDDASQFQGWGYANQYSSVAEEKYHEGVWVPLSVGPLLIGYANATKSRHRAMMMQGMINGLYLTYRDELNIALQVKGDAEWERAFGRAQVPLKPNFGKVLSLRMSSMETPVIIPLGSDVSLNYNELSFKAYYAQPKGASLLKKCYIDGQRGGKMFWDGIEFDFVSVYDLRNDAEGFYVKMVGGIAGESDELTSVCSVEWFGDQGAEIRQDDEFIPHSFGYSGLHIKI